MFGREITQFTKYGTSVPVAHPKQIVTDKGTMALADLGTAPFVVRYPAAWTNQTKQATSSSVTYSPPGGGAALTLIPQSSSLTLDQIADGVIKGLGTRFKDLVVTDRKAIQLFPGPGLQFTYTATAANGMKVKALWVIFIVSKVALNAQHVVTAATFDSALPLFTASIGTLRLKQ